jgi:hypothetical protein
MRERRTMGSAAYAARLAEASVQGPIAPPSPRLLPSEALPLTTSASVPYRYEAYSIHAPSSDPELRRMPSVNSLGGGVAEVTSAALRRSLMGKHGACVVT